MVLFSSCILKSAGHFTKKFIYEKLRDKKIKSDAKFFEKNNLFQCINHCQKKTGCEIFNFNSKLQICQITNNTLSGSHSDVTFNNGWDVYLQLMKKATPTLMEFKSNLTVTVKMDFSMASVNFSVCFWFQYDNKDNRKEYTIARFLIRDGCPVFTIYLATNTYLTVIMGNDEEHKLNFGFKRNTLYHVCYVHSSDFATWYLDGKVFKKYGSQGYKVGAKYLLIGQYSSDCQVFSGAFEESFLFDFNIFQNSLSPLEVELVMKRVFTVLPIVPWKDVKRSFANVSTVKFKDMHITKLEDRCSQYDPILCLK